MQSALTAILLFLVGLALGLLAMRLYSRVLSGQLQTRLSAATTELSDKSRRLENLTLETRNLVEAKARAEEAAQRISPLERQLVETREAYSQLLVKFAEAQRDREAEHEKVRWLESAQQKLRDAFQALAAEALRTNAEGFLSQAKGQLEGILSEVRGDWKTQKEQVGQMIQPLGETLEQLDEQVQALEQKREGAYQRLQEQLRQLAETHSQLQTTTVSLVQALKSPTIRARWGEFQLRRVVEMAGMVPHVDFSEQPVTETGRPDAIIHLPNGGVLPVDAKAPMQAYLEAMEAVEQLTRNSKLDMHVRAFRQHVHQLATRRYWQQFEHGPELVVMFVPNDACLSAAFDREPDLLEFAIQQRVLVTTPTTLIGFLQAVAYGWQQLQVAQHAQKIADESRQLHDRLRIFLTHLTDLGKRLDQSVEDYNEAVGSLESRVLPAARRFREMGVTTEELPEPVPVERRVRLPAPLVESPELPIPLTPLPATTESKVTESEGNDDPC